MRRVFSELSYDEAAAKAGAEGKWLLVDFTSRTCGPCQAMEATTWAAPEVEAWAAAKAIAVQVHADAQPELWQRFRIRAMPTVVVLGAGEELDRASGARSPEELLAWLADLEEGKTLLDAQREVALGGGLYERMELAEELHERGKLAEAAEHALWVWEQPPEGTLDFIRLRLNLADLTRELLPHLPWFHPRLSRVRDAIEAQTHEDVPGMDREFTGPDQTPEFLHALVIGDFLSLNRLLGAPERTLAWLERVRPRKPGLEWQSDLVEVLVEQNRWSDLGRLYADPVAAFEREVKRMKRYLEGPPPGTDEDEFDASFRQLLRDDTAVRVRALLAAGRHAEAETVRARALEVDASAEMRRAVAGLQ